MPRFSAAREVLRCRSCHTVMLVLTLEAPQPAATCVSMLDVLIDAFQMRTAAECDACMIRQQLQEQPHVSS